MSGWISIGEPDVQSLTPLEIQVKRYLDKGYHPNVISCIIKQSREQTRDLIYEIRKKEGIMRKATITDDEKQTMKRMYAEGKSVNEIAEATGRGRSSVDRIVNDRKPAQINPEFEAATNQMVAEMRAATDVENDAAYEKRITAEFDAAEAAELEDVENGIPNTPLISANAEKKSANAEEWRLPLVVQNAVDRYIADTTLEIEQREERIDELKEEVAIERAKLQELIDFRRKYREKVDAAEART